MFSPGDPVRSMLSSRCFVWLQNRRIVQYIAMYCIYLGPFASTRDRVFFLCLPLLCCLFFLLITTTVALGSCHTSLCHVHFFLRPIVDIFLRSIQYYVYFKFVLSRVCSRPCLLHIIHLPLSASCEIIALHSTGRIHQILVSI